MSVAMPTANILLVDDHTTNLATLKAVLEPLGQRLVGASSGEQALTCLLREEFAVVLMDVRMPGLDGFETVRLVRQRERSQHLPIIFLTAYGQEEMDVIRGHELGAVDFVFKPFNPEVLRAKVAALVRLFHAAEELRRREQALREAERAEAEERARLLDLTNDAIVIRDLDSRILFWSRGAEALYGWTQAEALGQESHTLLQSHYPQPLAEIEETLRREGRWEGEVLHTTRTGQHLVMDSRQALHTGHGGRLIILESNTDVTERQQLLAAVESKERLLRAVLEQMPSGFVLAETDGRITYANAQAEVAWGHSLIQSTNEEGSAAYRHFHPDGREYPPEQLPLSRAALRGEVVRGEVLWLRKGEADNRFIKMNCAPIRDADGRTVAAVAVFDNITEARRAEEHTARLHVATSALSRALTPEDVARVVLTAAVEGLGARGGIVYLRQPDGSLRALHDVGPDETDALQSVSEAIRQGSAVWLESLESSWAALPMMVHDKAVGSLVLSFAEPRSLPSEDRAFLIALVQQCGQALERARLFREAQEAVSLRDEFLSVASHELKTPLTPLQLKLQGLRRETEGDASPEGLRERVMRAVDGAEAQVRKLATLVNSLLDVSRIGAGKLRLELEDVDLAEVVREVVARFGLQAHKAECPLVVEVPAELVGRWDKLRLEQIVTNLLTNALKYGAGKPICLSLSQEGGRVRFSVQDEGIGIEPRDQLRIFQRFERAVSDRHYGGLGLGLYITQQVVEALGGTISVQSEPGRGARFDVLLGGVASRTKGRVGPVMGRAAASAPP